ncbi:MAG TPA: CHASE2 domain-containing protein, partial [Beijerinckiaceae bacterium]|nr:CHASE2 domain-containing protein [Beijerinckiaceae bacterium]
MRARLVALVCGVAMAMLALAEPLPVRALRDLLFDGYQRLAPRPFDPAMPVRIIDIDDESLQRLGQWPWPRTILARLIATIGAGGPAALGLDIVLSEAD